jgi:hypothetical protein
MAGGCFNTSPQSPSPALFRLGGVNCRLPALTKSEWCGPYVSLIELGNEPRHVEWLGPRI